MGHPPTISGKVPEAFLRAMKKTEEWTPGNCKGLEHIYALSQEKEHERREQKVGERRCPLNQINHNRCSDQDKSIDWNMKRSMGIEQHPFASPSAVMPRVFRYTIETDVNTKFQYFVKDCEIFWKAKQIRASLYETKDFECDEVLHAYSSCKNKRPLTVIMYDGCGVPIMAYRFHGVAVHTYSTPLDYAGNDILTHKVVFKYQSVEKLKRPTKSE